MPTRRRNGRKQGIHLAIARAAQKTINEIEGKDWREGNGRPKATCYNSEHYKIVQEWRKNNPTSENKSLCARETGLTRPRQSVSGGKVAKNANMGVSGGFPICRRNVQVLIGPRQ